MAGEIPSFSVTDVQEAMSGLDPSQRQLVMDGLQQQTEARKIAEADKSFHNSVRLFATAVERSASEGSSESNIEGWYSFLGECAERLLLETARRPALSEAEREAQQFSAVMYTYYSSEFDHDVDLKLLEANGITGQEILSTFRAGIIAADLVDSDDSEEVITAEVNELVQTITDLSDILEPHYWKTIVVARIAKMRSMLIAEGYVLPELDADGQFGEDDDINAVLEM